MKTDNVILTKTFQFSVRIVKLHLHLIKNKIDKVLSLQVLRSGISIGANVEEVMGGSSKKDFIQKLQIAYREARETKYWLRLLKETDLLDIKLSESLIADCDEIMKILTAIIKSSHSSNTGS